MVEVILEADRSSKLYSLPITRSTESEVRQVAKDPTFITPHFYKRALISDALSGESRFALLIKKLPDLRLRVQ